jgi:hypothetical protein
MHRASVVDRVLTDSLSIQPGVDVWLRDVERKAIALHQALRECEQGAHVITRLKAVRRDLTVFLEDEIQSPLHRLLRRPLSQIGPGTPAAKAFDVQTTRLFRQAQDALDAQQGAEALFDQLAQLRSGHDPRMPFFTRSLLERVGISEETIRSVRRASDARLLLRRLSRVESRLSSLARYLPAAAEAERFIVLDGTRVVSTAEMWSALQLTLRERKRSERKSEHLKEIRALQARQLRQLGRAGGWRHPGNTLAHAVAEHLAEVSLRLDHEVVSPGSDTELWMSLLGAAERARFAPPEQYAWQPRVSTPSVDRTQEQHGDTTVYVVYIDEGFVYLSQAFASPVRLWSRAVHEGEQVEARVFGDPASEIPLAWIQSDIAPLFDGTDPDHPAWYTTQRRASLEVLGRYQDGWFARLHSRGAVRRMTESAWQEGERTLTAVRVFESGSADRGDRVLPVGANRSEPHRFLGLETHEVNTPRIGCRIGWLRLPQRDRPSLNAALEREHALFRELRRRSPDLAVRSIGRAQLDSGGSIGLLYAPPLAVRSTDSPLITEWLRESPRALLGALLRTVLAVHESGYALGVHHLNLYAFGLELTSFATPLQPRATLVAAPFAVRLGHAFSPPSTEASQSPPEYPRLGFRGFPPAVQQGEIALPETDMVGMALMLLDVLSTRSLLPDNTTIAWANLPSHVEQHVACFGNAEWALRLAQALSTAGNTAELTPLIEEILMTDDSGSEVLVSPMPGETSELMS